MVWATSSSVLRQSRPVRITQWWRIWTQKWCAKQVKWWRICHPNNWQTCNKRLKQWWEVVVCQVWAQCLAQDSMDWTKLKACQLAEINKLRLSRQPTCQLIRKWIMTRPKVWRLRQITCSRRKSTTRPALSISLQSIKFGWTRTWLRPR